MYKCFRWKYETPGISFLGQSILKNRCIPSYSLDFLPNQSSQLSWVRKTLTQRREQPGKCAPRGGGAQPWSFLWELRVKIPRMKSLGLQPTLLFYLSRGFLCHPSERDEFISNPLGDYVHQNHQSSPASHLRDLILFFYKLCIMENFECIQLKKWHIKPMCQALFNHLA